MLNKTLALLATMALLGAACSSDENADAVDAAEEAQTALVEAFLSSDTDAAVAVYADEVVFADPMFGTSTRGLASMTSQANTVFPWTDTSQTVVLDRFVSADGTDGVVVYRWVGTNGAGPFDLTLVQIHEYEDGQIRQMTNYYGNRDAGEQLGL